MRINGVCERVSVLHAHDREASTVCAQYTQKQTTIARSDKVKISRDFLLRRKPTIITIVIHCVPKKDTP